MPGAGLAGNRLFRVSVYLKGEEKKRRKKTHTHSPCYMYGDKIFFVIGFVHRTLLCSLCRQTLSSCSTASDEVPFFPALKQSSNAKPSKPDDHHKSIPFPADGLGFSIRTHEQYSNVRCRELENRQLSCFEAEQNDQTKSTTPTIIRTYMLQKFARTVTREVRR